MKDDWGGPYKQEQEEKKQRRSYIVMIIAVIAVIVIMIPVSILLGKVLFPAHVAMESIDTAYGVVDKVMDADKAIYNYEWFKDKEANIRKCVKNEEIAKEEWEAFKADLPSDRTQWTRDDKTEEASLRNSYYALRKLTNSEIEDYNAKSSMVTRNVFKDNLPSNIDRALYAGKELTE